MAALSTRQKLLSLLDDVEIISKEFMEILTTPKQQQSDDNGIQQLIDLLVQKDKDIQSTLKTAKEQGDLQKKYESLKAEVESRDQDIRHLQKSLKDIESILSTAIFQAKQKLKSVSQANGRKISSEELIKYAHKISASNAVAAPSTWAPGDPRRPYPTEIDMRLGILTKLGDPNISNQALQQQASFPEMNVGRGQSHLEHALQNPQQTPAPTTLPWQHSVELPSNIGGGGHGHSGLTPPAHGHPLDGKSHTPQKDAEDVEIMSSDSSSSSSSDE